MQLKKDMWFIIKALIILIALLIIGKFFIWDEYIEPKEKNEIKQPQIIEKNNNLNSENIIDEGSTNANI